MDKKFNDEEKKQILRLATFIGELMLANGAETYRVEDSVTRICKSRGFNHINVFITPTVIIISDDRFDGYSFMKIIKKRSINLNNISLLNGFSRKFVSDTNIRVDEALDELKHLNTKDPFNPYIANLFTAIGSASFAVLAGGDDVITFILTLITSILAMISFEKVMKISNISAFATLIASILIAIIGVSLTKINIIDNPRMLIVGSIMPLLPGVPFMKAIDDLISGDLISGVARAFDALITAFAIASGVLLVINIYLKAGGVL
ncbi:MAG: threonine/serine exporter family protein [Peptostreptococcaceae bacterium]